MRFLSLFAGIGGFDLGLERAGMECVGQVEIDPFCQKVLAKHWPDVKRMTDIRDVKGDEFGPVDLISGGFPCQDISLAGRGAGLTGERSGLWFEYARIIGEVGPRWVIIENVPALRSRGFVTVLQNLSTLGYDAEWHCMPASHVGAPHRRDRIWIVAYPTGSRGQACCGDGVGRCGEAVAHPNREGLPLGQRETIGRGIVRDTGKTATASSWWLSEPDVGRVALGVPSRVDRLRSLGNAVVPQVVEMIGRAIMEANPS